MKQAQPPAIRPVPAPADAHPRLARGDGSPIVAAVDAGRCSGCGICVGVCPDEAISIDGIAVVDPALCTACSACVLNCPNQALSLVRVPPRRSATG
jgi:ferredoxin